MTDTKHRIGLRSDDHDYTFNGVRYIVSSRFTSSGKGETLKDHLKAHIKSNFADLTVEATHDNIEKEYVCSTAGKED